MKKTFSLHRFFSSFGFLFGLLVFLFSTTAVHADTSGVWTYTGNMAGVRQGGSATLLHNGKVLVVGGGSISTTTGQYDSKATELYDPTTGTWSNAGDTLYDTSVYDRIATLLPNGKVVSGSNLYDPDTNSWSDAGNIPNGLVLPNGKVLGLGWGTSTLYDPNTSTTTTLNNTGDVSFVSNWSVTEYTETVLSDGRVLIAGGMYCYNGCTNNDFYMTNHAAIYDPNTATWSRTGDMVYAHGSNLGGGTLGGGRSYIATLLQNGKILVAGGNGCISGYEPSSLNCSVQGVMEQAEIFDPTSGTWSATGSLNYARTDYTATVLPNGKVLVAGGNACKDNYNPGNGSCPGPDNFNSTLAELYDPTSGTWSATGSLNESRIDPNAVLLQNGKVLIEDSPNGSAATELFNLAPSVGTITVSTNPVQVNTATTASATFTDVVTGSHTATWNWGDGSTTGTVTEPNGSNPGSVGADSHSYAATGVYTITLTVTNTSNNVSGASTYQYVAVYDSSTSFAGGSSYDNPSSASPNTTGKVKFGITSKYNNSNVLTGSAKMNFKAANIDFASTSLSTLATSNGKAYLQGSGTVNGNSGYTFLATGIDGSVAGGSDKIRFQIKNSSNTVIYDSQPGAGNTDDPTTVDTTGNIRVH